MFIKLSLKSAPVRKELIVETISPFQGRVVGGFSEFFFIETNYVSFPDGLSELFILLISSEILRVMFRHRVFTIFNLTFLFNYNALIIFQQRKLKLILVKCLLSYEVLKNCVRKVNLKSVQSSWGSFFVLIKHKFYISKHIIHIYT